MSIVAKAAAGTAIVLAAAAYLCFWPVPAEPVAWPAPTPPGFTGAFAPNARLSGLRTIDLGGEVGPEHVAIGPDGKLYAAMEGGRLLRMEPDGSKREVFASTGGRVLGFDFDASGRLIAADAFKGLLAIDAAGRVGVLADRVATGDPIGYADAIVVAPDGTLYFTDASTRFSPARWGGTLEASVLDIMEQSATGRVLAHDPATGRTRIVARGFSFANGIALAADGHTLFVTETGRYRIWKIDGRASDLDVQAGGPHARVLLDNLPGYPDNIMRGRDGRLWVGLLSRATRQRTQPPNGRSCARCCSGCRGSCCRWASRTDTSSRSTRRAASPPTCRTRAAPTTRRERPRPRTGSTSTVCRHARWAGCRDDGKVRPMAP